MQYVRRTLLAVALRDRVQVVAEPDSQRAAAAALDLAHAEAEAEEAGQRRVEGVAKDDFWRRRVLHAGKDEGLLLVGAIVRDAVEREARLQREEDEAWRVQKALDRVKRIAPFPAGMSGAKKTFNLNFNSRSFQ